MALSATIGRSPLPYPLLRTNAFGLGDMHDNVWECCLDPWHETYNGVPREGRVWINATNEPE